MSDKLNELIEELCNNIDEYSEGAGYQDVYTGYFEKGSKLLRLVPQLFDKIKEVNPDNGKDLEERFLELLLQD